MTGSRKSAMIRYLSVLNEKFDLGLKEQDIHEMSTNQLRKKIFSVKRENKLTIHPNCKVWKVN